VSTIEELLGRKSSGSGLENREYGHKDPSRSPRYTLYQQTIGTNFADKRKSLGRCSSLADSRHGVQFQFSVLAITNKATKKEIKTALQLDSLGKRKN
jgi:hypothetical protein